MVYKQVIDFSPGKGMTVAQSDEHQRNWSERGWESALAKGNYDPTREHLNFEIRNGKIQPVDKSKSIPQLMKENLDRRGIKDPNVGLDEPKYRTVANFIFGGTRERMLELAFGNQKVGLDKGSDNSHLKRHPEIEQWAMDTYNFVCGKFGKDNVIAFIVHLDEKNPHCHCTVVPVDENNKISFRKVFIGQDNSKFAFRDMTLKLHDEYSEVTRKWGFNRGTSITETGAHHRSTEEYKRHLDEVCFSLKDEIEQHRKVLRDLNTEIKIAQRRVKGLTTMVQNGSAKVAEIEHEIQDIQHKLDTKSGDEVALQARINNLRRQKKDVEEKLDDKTRKLYEANQKLAALQKDMDEINTKLTELKSTISQNSFTAEERARYSIQREVMNTMLGEFRSNYKSHHSEFEQIFGESLLIDMSERSNEIMSCAMLLFLEMVDQATTVAQTHGGGGGGGSKKGWGRDPEEDDRAWARRCLAMAGRMMKPASKRKR